MEAIQITLAEQVQIIRQAAYREVLGLSTALDVKAAYLNKTAIKGLSLSGLGFLLADYQKLQNKLPKLLDKRYFYLATPFSESEYPYPQMRICVNGTAMEHAESADYAMHQGIFIDLHLLAVPGFLAAMHEKSYKAIQSNILKLLSGSNDAGVDSAQLEKLLLKRRELMEREESAQPKRYYQIFPMRAEDYAVTRMPLEALDWIESVPNTDNWSDLQPYSFEISADLLKVFT